jgi:hypothetical protein
MAHFCAVAVLLALAGIQRSSVLPEIIERSSSACAPRPRYLVLRCPAMILTQASTSSMRCRACQSGAHIGMWSPISVAT